METPTQINERIIGKITEQEKDYTILTQRQTMDVVQKRILNATRFINSYITWLKNEHPDKWVTMTLLKTILDYLGKNRITISVNGVKHEVFETNMTHHEIIALTNQPANLIKYATYGESSLKLFPDDTVFVTEGMEFTI